MKKMLRDDDVAGVFNISTDYYELHIDGAGGVAATVYAINPLNSKICCGAILIEQKP